MQISALLRAYQVERQSSGYSPETISRVVLNVEMFCRETRTRSLDRMTTERILRWGTDMLLSGKRQSTVYAYYNSIRSFVCFLEDTAVPHDIDKARIHCKPVYERLTVLRPADVRRIADYADKEASLLVRLMYTSGMRISETISLAPHNIDGIEVFIRGKGGKVRTVFITPGIAKELEMLRKDDELFFNMNRAAAYYKIKKAMVEAGYPNAYPHSLRHTFTTTMLRNGATLSHVQRLLGHSNISTTQRYEHLLTDDIRKAHKKYLVVI